MLVKKIQCHKQAYIFESGNVFDLVLAIRIGTECGKVIYSIGSAVANK